MSTTTGQRQFASHDVTSDAPRQPPPGKTARSEAIQRKARASEGSAARTQEAAQAGVLSAGGPLPFYDQIQASFGAHDISGISAHVGGPASAACEDMGAEAYATGSKVAFRGAPDLHTTAHEAAHVVQQRGGVQLKGGVGEAGDAHEQHADRVADLVVAGQSAQGLLDAYGRGHGGGGGGAVQHLLTIGGKEIAEDKVEELLQGAVLTGELTKEDMQALLRLQKEAGAKEDFHYKTAKDAVVGIRQHALDKFPSVAIKRGSIVFTNVSKQYHAQAELLLEALDQHPSIQMFLNNRPCFLSLVDRKGNPASVEDVGKQVNVDLACWYFDSYPLGFVLGMLMHEFAVHPMADARKGVLQDEKGKIGTDLPTGVMNGKKAHTVNTKGAGQQDHIFAATWGEERQQVYLEAVIDMAMVLLRETMKKDSKISPVEITNLFDCFLMDCASILATNDHRGWGIFHKQLIADIYNDYAKRLAGFVGKNLDLQPLLPAPKDPSIIFGNYKQALGNVVSGLFNKPMSLDTGHYQPTQKQLEALEKEGRYLHWIEPDGRCVFGALGYVVGKSSHDVIQLVLELLNLKKPFLTGIITNAGLGVEDVIECIRKGDWGNPKVGDIILEVAAVALGIGVTILMPNGTTWSINGGGALILRVTSPLEHYHAATAKKK